MFLGLGPKPEEHASYETTGAGEPPETRRRLRRVPDTMTTVPAVLLAASLTVGAALLGGLALPGVVHTG